MTFADWLDENRKNAKTLRQRVRMRYAANRCRIDAAFAMTLEQQIAEQHGLTGNIDWSQIDWEKVLQIVLLILEAFL